MSVDLEVLEVELRRLTDQVERVADAAVRIADALEQQAGYTADLAETADEEARAAAFERYEQGKGPKPK